MISWSITFLTRDGSINKASRIPSYDKVIEEDIEDEEAEEAAEEFELAHNFRYEQEGGAQIQTFSVTLKDRCAVKKTTKGTTCFCQRAQSPWKLQRKRNSSVSRISKWLKSRRNLKNYCDQWKKTVASVEEVWWLGGRLWPWKTW